MIAEGDVAAGTAYYSSTHYHAYCLPRSITIAQPLYSLMQCARACFNRKDCNCFVYSSTAHICSLKKISDLNLAAPNLAAVTAKDSICGLFPKRVPISRCDWHKIRRIYYGKDTGTCLLLIVSDPIIAIFISWLILYDTNNQDDVLIPLLMPITIIIIYPLFLKCDYFLL